MNEEAVDAVLRVIDLAGTNNKEQLARAVVEVVSRTLFGEGDYLAKAKVNLQQSKREIADSDTSLNVVLCSAVIAMTDAAVAQAEILQGIKDLLVRAEEGAVK